MKVLFEECDLTTEFEGKNISIKTDGRLEFKSIKIDRRLLTNPTLLEEMLVASLNSTIQEALRLTFKKYQVRLGREFKIERDEKGDMVRILEFQR
ncbi:MAG: hypothetical protein ABSH06_03145 [Thermodesulfobacteriota bacterium]